MLRINKATLYYRLFELLLQAEMSKMLKPIIGNHYKDFAEVLDNNLFDKNGPKHLNRHYKSEELFLSQKLFKPYLEINYSLINLQNIQVFIKTFPYKIKNISKLEYLRYHYSNYFAQIYILYERIEAFYKIILRSYKNDVKDFSKLNAMFELISKYFEKLKNVRNVNTHQSDYNDNALQRLSLIDFYLNTVVDNKIKRVLLRYFTTSYNKVKKEYLLKNKKHIESITILINSFFQVLVGYITDKGSIVYPKNIRDSSIRGKP